MPSKQMLRSWVYRIFIVGTIFGCSETSEPECPELTIRDLVHATNCETADGSVSVVCVNGTKLFINGILQRGLQVSLLKAGNYHIRIQNDNCSFSDYVRVKALNVSGIVFSDVRPILTTYCAVSDCHNGDNGRGNFNDLTSVREYGYRIMIKTSEGIMPPSHPLDDALIAQIRCWVVDGMPE